MTLMSICIGDHGVVVIVSYPSVECIDMYCVV